LHAAGALDEAAACLEHAIALDGTNWEAHFVLGSIRAGAGELEAAVSSYAQAARLRPDFAEGHNALGNTLRVLGRVEDAVASFERALELDSSLAAVHSNLGSALHALHRYEPAVASLHRALALDPELAHAHVNLGNMFCEAGRVAEAEASFVKAGALRPTPGLKVKLATLLPVVADSAEALWESRRRFTEAVDALLASELRLADPLREVGTVNFYLAYHGADDRELQERMARFYLRACPGLAWTAPGVGDRARRATGRLRVGIVSSYLQNHTVGKLTRGFVERLTRDRFEVVLFPLPGRNDPTAVAIAAAADRTVSLPNHLAAARERIAAEAPDVLFYPDVGMFPTTYFLSFARLAPVQCVTWGHPVTTGVPALDYFLSSELVEPNGAERDYSERLIRLPRLPVCYPRPPSPVRAPDRGRLGLDPDAVLYVCAQSLFKLHPDFDAIVAAILRADRRGRLVLIEGPHPHWGERLRARFARVMPEVVDRIQFLPRLAADDFLGLLATANVLLDPLHFGSGNSAYEALAVGTPIVTWPGRFMRGRVTLGCYRQLGVLDAVVADADAYVARAVQLANDREARETLRTRLLDGSDQLFDDDAAVRQLEDFFERACAAGRS
jgi:predicted O-linked N-acetylglucosamine transferase (SPINDLY family)